MTQLARNRLPKAILTLLAQRPVPRQDLYATASALSGNRHTAAVAIERLMANGLAECSVRLTRKGRRILKSETAT